MCVCDYMFIVFPPPPLVLWSWSMGRNRVFFSNQGLRKKSKTNQGRLEEIGYSINNNYIGGFMPTIKSMYLGC